MFFPKSRRAYIFTDLAQAHAAFMRRLKSLGCAFAQGLAPAAILRDPTRASQPVAGVLFMPVKHGQPLAISAKAVVVALGGPAGLFARAMSGPASPGYSYGLMGQAGVKLINTGFIQFMWTKQPEGGFWQPAEAVADGWKIITADDREIPIPDLIPMRWTWPANVLAIAPSLTARMTANWI